MLAAEAVYFVGATAVTSAQCAAPPTEEQNIESVMQAIAGSALVDRAAPVVNTATPSNPRTDGSLRLRTTPKPRRTMRSEIYPPPIAPMIPQAKGIEATSPVLPILR